MKIIMKGASILMAVFMVSMVMSPVFAAPPLPFDREGNADVNDTYITSWIDGTEYGNDTTDGVGDFFLATQSDETLPDGKKTGGQDGVGDIIQYAIGDLTGTETATFFTETDAFLIGGYSAAGPNADLNSGDVVRLLKINNISFASQYVVIHNPTSIAVDMDTYSIAVGVGGPQAIAATDYVDGMYMWNVNSIPAGGYFALDMSKIVGIGAANALELSIGGHIVDKVEYGAIATEPENTLLRNAAAPGATEIQRVAPGSDSNDCNADFAAGPEFLPLDLVNPIVTCVDLGVIGIATLEDATATDPAPSSGIATYAWTQIGGPGVVAFGSAATEDTTVAGTTDGLYTCQLEVTDVAGNSGTDTFTFTWDSTIPTVTCVDLGVIGIATLEDATAADANGIATYAWTQTGGPGVVTFGTPAAEDTTVAGTLDGLYTCQLEVTDNVGLTNSDTFTFTWDSTIPTVTVPDLGWINAATLMDATAADANGIATYAWTQTAGPGVTTFGTPAAEDTTVAGTIDGIYTVQLEVTDNVGLTNSDTGTYGWDITVPTVACVDLGDIGTTPTLEDATTDDVTSGIASYAWTQTGGPGVVTFGTPTAEDTTVAGTLDGLYTCQLLVTDNAGNTNTDTFTFTWTSTLDTATADGPTGNSPNGDYSVAITYTWTGTPATVEIFYSENGVTPFVSAGTEAPDGSFDWTIPGGNGDTYDWIVNAVGGDDDGVGIAAGPAEAGTYTMVDIAGGVTPWDIACHKSGNDLVIDWTTGSGPFEVFIADTVTGAGPYVSLASGIAANTYTHVGALTDGLSHSYYVTAGDGETSNLGFKLVKSLVDNGLSLNWIALPYKSDITTADQMMDDINSDGPGGDAAYIVTQWDTANQIYQSRTDLGAPRIGVNFAIAPGIGYQVKMNAAMAMNWNIVGAAPDKDASYVSTDVTVSLVSNGLALNWIALPYNTILTTADEMMDAINAAGPGGDAVYIATQWDTANQIYQSRTDLGAPRIGVNFALAPGAGYQIKMNAAMDFVWTISDNVLEP